jgi:serine/threonine protein kinase/Flp pilus assembly protein TadD
MTPELWQRLKPLYEAALEMPALERTRFVEGVCGSDVQLKKELENLLRAAADDGSYMNPPLFRLKDLVHMDSDVLSEGQVLLGRFQIVRHLGSGGMGEVYEARDRELQMGRVALKVIRRSIAQNPVMLSRFKEEAILARKVSGPNVCRIHEFYVADSHSGVNCNAFLTMEYLDGRTLSELIDTTGPLPIRKALEIALQLCEALRAIHEAGVIHRDLKPRNIMLVPSMGGEKVVVMDFGLAHAVVSDSGTNETRRTQPGVVMGTPEYMAPEQFEGQEASPATDIYALGLVLYELVTGKRLFAASTPFAVAVRRGRRPELPSAVRREIPSVWDDVVAKCLEYEPGSRFQSAREVIDEFHRHRFVIWRFRNGQRISLTRGVLVASVLAIALIVTLTARIFFKDALSYHLRPEVKEWYDKGSNDLREGTYFKATKALAMAVQLDQKYPLTHARLAEAWTELDFTGEAEREMLHATSPQPEITFSSEESRYVNAIRNTLIHDYSAAAQNYEAILKDLPDAQKPEGMVDLGRAYEKAGRTKEALEKYEVAAKRRPNNPAPFVHIGILKSRLRDLTGAEVAFAEAEKLYKASSNDEGIAEVEYQRGYAANDRTDFDHARENLNKSLAIANEIGSMQLRVRSLAQLTSVDYLSGYTDRAVVDANQVIQLAKDNGLEYWIADGWMRLGNAYMFKGELKDAESAIQQSLNLAHQNQHPRIEANANLTMANIRDQQGKPDETISYAELALKYFRDYGFLMPAAKVSATIMRAEEKKGDIAHAREAANALLQLARKGDSDLYAMYAEEELGNLSFNSQDYPAALIHFEGAFRASQSIPGAIPYMSLHCADILWRLGRYAEAEHILDAISPEAQKSTLIALGVARIQAQMKLSRLQNKEALAIAKEAIRRFPEMSYGQVADFEEVIALAQVRLNRADEAAQDAEKLMALGRTEADQGVVASGELAEAQALVALHRSGIAMAEAASAHFAVTDEKESKWLSLFYAAQAARAAGNADMSAKDARKSIDILKELEQDWGSPAFHQYATRPDNQLVIHELSVLNERKEESHHAKP